MRKTTFVITAVAASAVAAVAFAQPPGGGRGPLTPEQQAERFKAADTNSDGKVSKEEFAASMAGRGGGRGGGGGAIPAEMLDQLFTSRDTNSDGSLSAEEFAAPMGRGGGRGGPPPAG